MYVCLCFGVEMLQSTVRGKMVSHVHQNECETYFREPPLALNTHTDFATLLGVAEREREREREGEVGGGGGREARRRIRQTDKILT